MIGAPIGLKSASIKLEMPARERVVRGEEWTEEDSPTAARSGHQLKRRHERWAGPRCVRRCRSGQRFRARPRVALRVVALQVDCVIVHGTPDVRICPLGRTDGVAGENSGGGTDRERLCFRARRRH